MMKNFLPSLGVIVTFGLAVESLANSNVLADELFAPSHQSGSLQGKILDRCCQVGREKAIESAKFNCKLSTREVLDSGNININGAHLFTLSADSLLSKDQNLADQCEMLLESCCIAFHRTRNCDSGKQFAKSGTSCMDVELSKEAVVATESFNDCCMSCSLGILAARNPVQNDTARSTSVTSDRCKLISPLASSLSGQLYEQTYTECCQENLPKPSSALHEPGAPIDCSQANACSHRCLASGTLDQITRRPIEQDRCDCFTGYKLAPDEITCLDIDECKLNIHTCNRQSEICDNTRGSFRCLARSAIQHKPTTTAGLSQHQQQHHFNSFHQSSSHHLNQFQQHVATRSLADNINKVHGTNAEPIERQFASLRMRSSNPNRW